MQTKEVILLIIRIVVLLAALWPYICLTYLTDLKKVLKELRAIRAELSKMNKEEKEEEKSDEGIRTGNRLD